MRKFLSVAGVGVISAVGIWAGQRRREEHGQAVKDAVITPGGSVKLGAGPGDFNVPHARLAAGKQTLAGKEKRKPRHVAKAFLITGGTEESRRKKYDQIIEDDVYLMHGAYKRGDELVIILSEHHSDYEGMSFEEAKSLAGSQQLGCDFRTTTYRFRNEENFGVIDLGSSSTLELR